MSHNHHTSDLLADMLAAQLGETAAEPIAQIQRAVTILGPTTVQAVLDEPRMVMR